MAPRRRCPVCGSKQWRKEPFSGLITCEEGHVLQNYRNESREVTELGPHAVRKRTLKSGRKRKERGSKANPKLYHGDRARFHYFQCLQLLLRMQIAALTKAWELPPEFEVICRDIWALYLSLLPNPPPPEPYLYALDEQGGKETQDVSEKSSQSGDRAEKDDISEQENEDKDDDGSDSSSSSGSDEEEDPELEKLLRENSETPSSSEDDENEHQRPHQTPQPKKRKQFQRGHDSPAGNISVLILACWTIRMPVMYMDFVRLIEAYDLPYLEPTRLLPQSLTLHLTKYTIQALSPHFAPTPMHLHRLTSRLAKRMYEVYSIYTPECNAAPLLWRTVVSLQGTPVLYMLTKRLASILSLPLTLHHSLSPNLAQVKRSDPKHHKYDNAPVEVSFAAVVIVVLKLVYGLDGRKRVPRDPDDPASALPRFSEYMAAIKKLNTRQDVSLEDILPADSNVSALDLDNKTIDEYLDFCEKALLPVQRNEERGVLGDFFPLFPRKEDTASNDIGPTTQRVEAAPPKTMPATQVHEESKELRPGEVYAIYHSQDVLGSLPEDCDIIIRRVANWAGMEADYVCGVVERYEHRLAGWWAHLRKQEKAETEAAAAAPSESDEQTLHAGTTVRDAADLYI